jgi:hypothetical protein
MPVLYQIDLVHRSQHLLVVLQAVVGPLRAERDSLLARHKQVMKRLEAEKDSYVAQVGHVTWLLYCCYMTYGLKIMTTVLVTCMMRHKQVMKRLEAEKDSYVAQVGHMLLCFRAACTMLQ